MFTCLTHVHNNACRCTNSSILYSGHLATTMPNFMKLHTPITKLQHFEHLKIGKNLHANMEGFHRAVTYSYKHAVKVRGYVASINFYLFLELSHTVVQYG